MVYYIEVSSPQDSAVKWGAAITENEYAEIKKKVADVKAQDHVIRSLFQKCLVPTRTNMSDVLIPTLSEHLDNLKHNPGAKNTIGDWLHRGFKTTLDMITLPVRIITFVPRLFYKAWQPENPVHSFLRNHGCTEKKIIDSDVVFVSLIEANKKTDDKSGKSLSSYKINVIQNNVYFTTVPAVPDNGIIASSTSSPEFGDSVDKKVDANDFASTLRSSAPFIISDAALAVFEKEVFNN